MKKIVVYPTTITGSVVVPSSKSHSHRAIIFGAMGSGTTTIRRLLKSPDTDGMLKAWKSLGVAVSEEGECVKIRGLDGEIDGAEDVIDVGNSGIALRFLTALSALSPKPIVITGDHSIRHQRPMDPLLQALTQLDAMAISTKCDGYAPIIVQGPLKGGEVMVNGRDSQPVSALLISSIFSKGTTRLVVEEPGEIPWVKLTLYWMSWLNIRFEQKNFSEYIVSGQERYKGFEYAVPGDWSSAAFPAAAALVTKSSVTLENLDKKDVQGDKKLFDLLEQMGAKICYIEEKKKVKVSYKEGLKGIDADINDCIDCITILSVVACFADGVTFIKNASVAKEKECNRIECIARELRKMGAEIETSEDGLKITGTPLHGAELDSHDDHRMAMSLVVAAMGADGASRISNIACMNKTYPSFIADMKSIGALIQ
ncbi:MAG: 3-phosphoshikimate 1-carboxyvinyltransferase [Chlamydiota bacterium]